MQVKGFFRSKNLVNLATYHWSPLKYYRIFDLKIFIMLIAILVPWLSFFINGKFIRGIVCLILQLTLIGWLPAAVWAVMSRNNSKMERKLKAMENRIITAQKNK